MTDTIPTPQTPAPQTRALAPTSPPPPKLRLPATREIRKWYEATVGLQSKLRAERDALAARIEADKVRLADMDRAIMAFDQLPSQIEIEAEPEQHRAQPANGQAWHPDYPDGCLDCKRTDRPYGARGYCKTCYPRHAPGARN